MFKKMLFLQSMLIIQVFFIASYLMECEHLLAGN